MPKREVFDAALRLADIDSDPGALDLLCCTASGGYGTKKQQRLLDDLRTLYRHALGDAPVQSPFGDSAA
jgi:hypothetical protein